MGLSDVSAKNVSAAITELTRGGLIRKIAGRGKGGCALRKLTVPARDPSRNSGEGTADFTPPETHQGPSPAIRPDPVPKLTPTPSRVSSATSPDIRTPVSEERSDSLNSQIKDQNNNNRTRVAAVTTGVDVVVDDLKSQEEEKTDEDPECEDAECEDPEYEAACRALRSVGIKEPCEEQVEAYETLERHGIHEPTRSDLFARMPGLSAIEVDQIRRRLNGRAGLGVFINALRTDAPKLIDRRKRIEWERFEQREGMVRWIRELAQVYRDRPDAFDAYFAAMREFMEERFRKLKISRPRVLDVVDISRRHLSEGCPSKDAMRGFEDTPEDVRRDASMVLAYLRGRQQSPEALADAERRHPPPEVFPVLKLSSSPADSSARGRPVFETFDRRASRGDN